MKHVTAQVEMQIGGNIIKCQVATGVTVIEFRRTPLIIRNSPHIFDIDFRIMEAILGV